MKNLHYCLITGLFALLLSPGYGSSAVITVTLQGTGGGSVHSSPSGISCSSGSVCPSASFTNGSAVTLTASPDANSTFSGWSGGGCAGTSSCVVTMDAAKSVTASFAALPAKVHLLGRTTPYQTLQSAYDAATNGDTLQPMAQAFSGDLLFRHPVNVVLAGGYDSSFLRQTGLTSLLGQVIVQLGSVTVDRLAINLTTPLPQVTLVTSKGTIVVELRPDKAPISVNNFLRYVDEGFYSNTFFHRVIKGFVVQGGGFDANHPQTLKATHTPITIELPAATGLSNTLGTIAMARATDLNSATSQFFINTVNNASLDTGSGGYAVFGSVVQGMNVVRLIESVPVDSNKIPTTMVTLTSATRNDPLIVSIPPAPTGVGATGGTNTMTLSWDDIPEAISYNAYVSRTPGVTTSTGAKITNLTPPIMFSALLANTKYYWIITAVNRAGESAPSAPFFATTAQLDGGIALYSDKCASCHGALASSTKRKATPTQIKTAITSVAAMKVVPALTSLSSAQIQTIANTLNF